MADEVAQFGTEAQAAAPALTARSLIFGLPILLMWIVLLSFSVPHEMVKRASIYWRP